MAKELLDSPEGSRWLPWFQKIFDEGGDVTADPATSLVLFLASGKAYESTGRFFAVPEDPVMVVERTACGCYLERHTFQTSKANPATYPAAA